MQYMLPLLMISENESCTWTLLLQFSLLFSFFFCKNHYYFLVVNRIIIRGCAHDRYILLSFAAKKKKLIMQEKWRWYKVEYVNVWGVLLCVLMTKTDGVDLWLESLSRFSKIIADSAAAHSLSFCPLAQRRVDKTTGRLSPVRRRTFI